MTALDTARERLADAPARARLPETHALACGLAEGAVAFAAVGGPLEERWDQAVRELADCIGASTGTDPVLSEGGVYHGAWIESTGTINAEVLSRFAPAVTTATHRLFAEHLRDDGLMPYKVTADGPAFSQIQIVTPLARSVWHHYLSHGRDTEYLATMYRAMSRMDAWLAEHRDTRGTGAVEAFCTFDTGHDLSPRFWGIADRCHGGDATRHDPANPVLPLVAPDLTANAACQRSYLARIAHELGLDTDSDAWRERARQSEEALWRECFDADDAFFYDRAPDGSHRRLQSDVLLRVLACEVGDDEFFATALRNHLLNTRKFLSGYGFTSIALDDPRFDRDFSRNSWAGPINMLSAIRAPHAFEAHGRAAELGLTALPLLGALAIADRFPQCLDPWSGAAGFTEKYSPAILWFLDAIERHTGVMPQPDGSLWLSSLTPTRLDHGVAADAVAYARHHAGVRYELAADDATTRVWRDGESWLEFPRGWRVVVDSAGEVAAVVGLSPTEVAGDLVITGRRLPLALAGNDRVTLAAGSVSGRVEMGVISPT